ncbi:unnamed protein product [Calicophoron daubneyi]|uniref:Uncharacterized protein n=1 Tax=Calicophoron daubneyi TaxID=300641 RepID=A0AAV2T580_CALDB
MSSAELSQTMGDVLPTQDSCPKDSSKEAQIESVSVNVSSSPALNASAEGSGETSEGPNATHLTIQLPDGMQGSTLSHQKLQDLILQLSRSGQIQLKEDSKIIIDLKFACKSENQSGLSKPEGSNLSTSSSASLSGARVTTVTTSGGTHVQPAAQNVAVSLKAELTRVSGPRIARSVIPLNPGQNQVISLQNVASTQSTATHVQPRQVQHQPTYILVPTAQLSGSSDGQLYTGSPHLRTVSTGGTVLRTIGGNSVVSAGNVGIGSSDRSFILVQQPLNAGGIVSSGANSIVVSNGSGATFLPLRQLTGVNNSSSLVSGNTSVVAAGHNRIVGPNSASDLYVTSSGSINLGARSNQGSLVAISAAAQGGVGQRESSWQQYVKQFTKLGPCPICGDRISGYHYGIFCCESCKGFFKRTVQNAKRYACHHPNASSLCEINVASRKKCPACRFIKCVDKGMRIEAIRSDRTRGGRSMYPGSRYLRQIAARVGGVRTGNTGLSNSQLDVSGSDQDSLNLSLLTGRGTGSEDPEQLSCAVVGLAGSHHNLGPDGLPASMDAGGGVYLDPGVLGNHGDEDDDVDQNSMHVDQSFLEYNGGVSSANLSTSTIGAPYVGRQVIVGSAAENAARSRVELPKVINDILLVEESMEAEPEDSLEIDSGTTPPGTSIPEGVSEDEAAVYRALLNLADQRLYRTVRWSRALPDFAQLDTDDQILLLQNCWADLLCLDCCWRSLPTPAEIRLTSSKCINLEAARELGAEEIVERVLHLTQDLTRLQLDLVEYACLKVIVLMQPDLKNLKAATHVREYQDSVRRLLMEYISNSSPSMRDKYVKLMSHIPELRVTSQTARSMLVDLDLSAYLSTNSLLMELLRSDIQRSTPSTTPAVPGKNISPTLTVEPCPDNIKIGSQKNSPKALGLSIGDSGNVKAEEEKSSLEASAQLDANQVVDEITQLSDAQATESAIAAAAISS